MTLFASQAQKILDTVCSRAASALLKDALRNLIENAVRHTPDSTKIIVRVGGYGIQVEDRQDVRPGSFVQQTRNAEGLGIGLKIVERIAELHKGSLRRSISRQGNMFELLLPAGEPKKG